jgi:hypothetical protein
MSSVEIHVVVCVQWLPLEEVHTTHARWIEYIWMDEIL